MPPSLAAALASHSTDTAAVTNHHVEREHDAPQTRAHVIDHAHRLRGPVDVIEPLARLFERLKRRSNAVARVEHSSQTLRSDACSIGHGPPPVLERPPTTVAGN